MIRKSGYRFSEKIMLKQKIERDDDSKKSHPALECRRTSLGATGFQPPSRRDRRWFVQLFRISGAADALMHRRGHELVLDALEMIKPFDGAVELRAVFLGELGLHVGNRVGELFP